jgi:hypothetical protein
MTSVSSLAKAWFSRHGPRLDANAASTKARLVKLLLPGIWQTPFSGPGVWVVVWIFNAGFMM